jgi:hypothetical protein
VYFTLEGIMQLQPTHEILASFPYGALPAPEIWRRSTRPAGWIDCPGLEARFGEWEERVYEEEVILSPELDAAYDRAIDAAFAKVKDLFCGPDRQDF